MGVSGSLLLASMTSRPFNNSNALIRIFRDIFFVLVRPNCAFQPPSAALDSGCMVTHEGASDGAGWRAGQERKKGTQGKRHDNNGDGGPVDRRVLLRDRRVDSEIIGIDMHM